MAKSFYTKVETTEGERVVHVNRRGCKGRWTKKDQEMLAALTEAVVQHFRNEPTPDLPRDDPRDDTKD